MTSKIYFCVNGTARMCIKMFLISLRSVFGIAIAITSNPSSRLLCLVSFVLPVGLFCVMISIVNVGCKPIVIFSSLPESLLGRKCLNQHCLEKKQFQYRKFAS